jgi:acid phosphatase (class A)
MKKNIVIIAFVLLASCQLIAQIPTPKKPDAIAGHYAESAQKSRQGTDTNLDTQKFPLADFRRLPYLKLRTNYLSDSPSSFKYPAPPANSSEQTKEEIKYLLKLQEERTTADTILYLKLADIYHDPFTFNTTDADYDRNFNSLFYLGKAIGEKFNYKNCPKTAMLLSKVIQDATYYVFTFKYNFSRPRPYQLEPKLINLQTLGHASYPSGHSSFSWVNAYVMQELVPQLKASFYEAAAELEFSREVIGVHYPSDGEAGRIWAREFVNRLFKNAAFLKDYKEAKNELQTLK